MGWRIPSLSKSYFLSHQLSHLTTVWQWLQSHLSYLEHHSHYTSYCKANILTNSTILYSVAFNLSIKEYYYNNLSSHSSLAKISYCSEIRTRTGGIRWPLFLHIIIYIQHMIHSILASMFGFPFGEVDVRAPPLISSDLHFSVIYCHCRTYDDTVGPKLQKRVIVFESFYPFFSPCHFCAVGVATFGHKFINSREK